MSQPSHHGPAPDPDNYLGDAQLQLQKFKALVPLDAKLRPPLEVRLAFRTNLLKTAGVSSPDDWQSVDRVVLSVFATNLSSNADAENLFGLMSENMDHFENATNGEIKKMVIQLKDAKQIDAKDIMTSENRTVLQKILNGAGIPFQYVRKRMADQQITVQGNAPDNFGGGGGVPLPAPGPNPAPAPQSQPPPPAGSSLFDEVQDFNEAHGCTPKGSEPPERQTLLNKIVFDPKEIRKAVTLTMPPDACKHPAIPSGGVVSDLGYELVRQENGVFIRAPQLGLWKPTQPKMRSFPMEEKAALVDPMSVKYTTEDSARQELLKGMKDEKATTTSQVQNLLNFFIFSRLSAAPTFALYKGIIHRFQRTGGQTKQTKNGKTSWDLRTTDLTKAAFRHLEKTCDFLRGECMHPDYTKSQFTQDVRDVLLASQAIVKDICAENRVAFDSSLPSRLERFSCVKRRQILQVALLNQDLRDFIVAFDPANGLRNSFHMTLSSIARQACEWRE